MMIKVTRSDLLKPLLQVSGIVERRQTLPILANVLIAARENQIDITATDLEIELRCCLPPASDPPRRPAR